MRFRLQTPATASARDSPSAACVCVRSHAMTYRASADSNAMPDATPTAVTAFHPACPPLRWQTSRMPMPEATPRVRRRPPPSPQAQPSVPLPLTLVLQSRSVRDTLNNLILKSPQNWRERRMGLKPGSSAAARADPTLLSHARSLSLSRAQRRASASPSSPSRARCAQRAACTPSVAKGLYWAPTVRCRWSNGTKYALTCA